MLANGQGTDLHSDDDICIHATLRTIDRILFLKVIDSIASCNV